MELKEEDALKYGLIANPTPEGYPVQRFERCIWAKGRTLEEINKAYPIDCELIPDLVGYTIWEYAKRVFDYCSEHRIDITAGLTRTGGNLYSQYRGSLINIFGIKHVKKVEKRMAVMLKPMERDFSILWFSVNNEYKRNYPDMEHVDMRTDAKIAIMMINYLRDHLYKIAKLVSGRCKDSRDVMLNESIVKLEGILYAYNSEYPINYNEHMNLWVKIFKQKIRSAL